MTAVGETPGIGVYFSVSVRARVSLDELARELEAALRMTLTRSDERGVMGDWFGEALGLRLWLFIADPPEAGEGSRFALIGESERPGIDGASWIDIGPYVGELLTARTHRAWTPSVAR